jgi:hypothetical protein
MGTSIYGRCSREVYSCWYVETQPRHSRPFTSPPRIKHGQSTFPCPHPVPRARPHLPPPSPWMHKSRLRSASISSSRASASSPLPSPSECVRRVIRRVSQQWLTAPLTQTLTFESDRFICVREKVNEQNQVVIIDLGEGNNVLRRPITADSAIMHPRQKILALKGASTASRCLRSYVDDVH